MDYVPFSWRYFCQDFAEFMALAVRGNVEKVSTTTAACRDATYFDKFPPNAVVHAFGNVLKPDYNGSLHNCNVNFLVTASTLIVCHVSSV